MASSESHSYKVS